MFQANVATRSPSLDARARAAPRHSRSTRSPTSAYVARVVPSSVSVTTSASPFMPAHPPQHVLERQRVVVLHQPFEHPEPS